MHTFLCAWVCLNSVLPISLSDLIMMTELMLAESKPLRILPYSALCHFGTISIHHHCLSELLTSSSCTLLNEWQNWQKSKK